MRWMSLQGRNRISGRIKRKGSAAVLLCILFVSLTGALAITYEASERKAAVSIGEAAFDNAGRSVLACYDKELFERYGLFAFEGDEEKTGQRLEKLAKASIESTKIAGCKINNVEAEQSAFCLADPDNLMLQIREITKRTAAADAVGGLKDELKTAGEKVQEKQQADQKIGELEKEREDAKQRAREAVENAGAEEEEAVLQEVDDPGDELEEIENAEQTQNHLKEQINSVSNEPSDTSGGRTLKNGRIIDSLPSVAAGCSGKIAFAGETVLKDLSEENAGEAVSDDLVAVAYIEHFFHDHLDADSPDQSFFHCETEYILYGSMSDDTNYRKAWASIFAVRTAVNTAYLYTDSTKRQLILDTAEVLTPGPYCLLTQLLLSALWAGAEAYNDMRNLEDGRGVPMWKTSETWMTDLDGILNGIRDGSSYIPVSGNSRFTYSRYLDLFLLTLNRDTKLYRIMDLIQINLKGTVREEFTVADHFTGFALKAEIGKKSHAVGVGSATADINMTHAYLTGG